MNSKMKRSKNLVHVVCIYQTRTCNMSADKVNQSQEVSIIHLHRQLERVGCLPTLPRGYTICPLRNPADCHHPCKYHNLVPSLRMIIITPPKKYQQEGYDNPNSVSIVYQSIRWGMISSTNKMFIPTGKRFSIIPNRSKNRRFSSFRPSTELCFAHSFSSLPARGPKMSQNVPGSTCMANGECVFI